MNNTENSFQEIPIKEAKKKFESHLKKSNRILFSGPFGSGKTYFLNRYFSEKEDYLTFHLYPVNYHIASNEDVFELIKYDIILKIFEKAGTNEIKLDEISADKISHKLALQSYFKNDGAGYALDFARSIPKVGGYISSATKLYDFFSNYQDHKSKLESNNRDILKDYINSLSDAKGVLEMDSFSSLINELINNNCLNKKEGKQKESVLILDDLDRLDPEHMFRILNVFSAHFDQVNRLNGGKSISTNKFGFDKIIVVTDINELREYFLSRYGKKTNFEGYIDKFYTKNVFHFDIISELHNKIEQLLLESVKSREDTEYFDFQIQMIKKHYTRFCTYLIRRGFLTIRDVKKFHSDKYDYFKHYDPKDFDVLTIQENVNPFAAMIDFFFNLLGRDENKLKEVFESFKNASIYDYHIIYDTIEVFEWALSFYIPANGYPHNEGEVIIEESGEKYTYEISPEKLYGYSFHKHKIDFQQKRAIVHKKGSKHIPKVDFTEVLLNAVEHSLPVLKRKY